jgi:two-component system response regulator GlrR
VSLAQRGEESPDVILVVDDEPDMLDNVARLLRRGAYRCVTATSGLQALATLAEERPDLILTDLRMPGMDGLALLRAAKRLAPATPVVIVTAFASDSAAREATEAGAAAFLAKPFSGAELLQTLRRALGREAPGGATPG